MTNEEIIDYQMCQMCNQRNEYIKNERDRCTEYDDAIEILKKKDEEFKKYLQKFICDCKCTARIVGAYDLTKNEEKSPSFRWGMNPRYKDNVFYLKTKLFSFFLDFFQILDYLYIENNYG